MADKERKMYNFPGNARSDVWKHFGFYAVDDNADVIEVDKSKAICKICRLAIKNHGNTTNLYNHITKRHGRELALDFHTKILNEPKFQCISSSTGTLDYEEMGSDKTTSITKAIFNYVVSDLKSISSIQTPAFKSLLYRLDSKYEVPCHDFLINIHFPRYYDETRHKILQIIRQNSNGCSLMIDTWKSHEMIWMSVSIQFIDNSWRVQSFLLKSLQFIEEPNFDTIQEVIENLKIEWCMNLPVSIVGHGELGSEVPAFKTFVPCLTKTINTAALKGFEIQEVDRLIKKAQKLICYLENHFQQVIQNLDRVAMEKSRWLSVYEMFQWLSGNTPIIEEILCASSTKEQSIDLLFTSEEQILCENILLAFKELKTASTILCEESQPLVSMILPILQKLLTSFAPTESENCVVRSVKSAVQNHLSKTYEHQNTRLYLIASSLLDPRYKELPFVSSDERQDAKELIFKSTYLNFSETVTAEIQLQNIETPSKRIKIESEPSTSASPLDDWFSDVVCHHDTKENSDLDKVTTEFNKFQFTDRVSANSDPLEWWNKHAILFPVLSQMAKQFLCTSATSVSATQIFTETGRDFQISRCLLTSSEVDMIMFLNKNFTSI